ncbi:MAG: amino acid ABC transporter substrate-binding protein [Clostridia bacterium]|nr:amino acid ABC transporter substrate-binding protein [Clostridia bacterium]
MLLSGFGGSVNAHQRFNRLETSVMKKTFVILLICLVLVSLVPGCGLPLDSEDDSLQKVLDAGKFVLGLDVGFPPMGYTDEQGNIVGFDIDVAREVCKRMGVELVTKGIDWDTKEDVLNDGTIDCIWNGLSVTPARAKSMNLSDPYMKNELIFVVLGSSDAKSISDLTGKKIGVQSGSTAKETLEKSDLYKYRSISVLAYEDNLTLLESLKNGEIDCALVDSVVAYRYIFSSEAQFFVLSDSLGEEEYAIGFRKNDKKLRDKVQEIISDMKADGTLGNISKSWFGSDITIVK